MKKIKVGDITLAYRWDCATSGPVVMMAHAMGTSHRIWDWQLPALSDRYRILRYDFRGHGDTEAPPGPYTLDQFVKDAVGIMDILELDKVHWVGISTGGMIGQGVAIDHGSRLHSLILCNTTSRSTQWYRDQIAKRQAVVGEGGMDAGWEMTKRFWFTDDYVDEEGPDYHTVRNVYLKTPLPGYFGGTSAVAELNYRPLLHKVKTPTLIIAAGDDPVTPVDHSEAINDGITGSHLEVIPGQRHFSNVEVPELFNKILCNGLDKFSENI